MSEEKNTQQNNKDKKEKTIREKFNEYCELNPEANECREYDV